MTREQKIILSAVITTMAAFLIGFGWQYSRAHQLENQLETTTADLTFKRLEAKLAAATIEADRGNYEIARQLASEFFTGLQGQLPQVPEDKQQELSVIASHRDAVITAASRSDPQSGSLLAQLYNTYRVAFGEAPVAAQPAPAPPTVTPQ